MKEDDWKKRTVEQRLDFLEGVADARSCAETERETHAYMARLILSALAKTLVLQGKLDGRAFIDQLRQEATPLLQSRPDRGRDLSKAIDELSAHLYPDGHASGTVQ